MEQSNNSQTRILILLGAFSVVFVFLAYKLFTIQVVQGFALSELAKKQRLRKTPYEGLRGSIYDRNGKELTVNLTRYSVYVESLRIKQKEKTAQILSAVLKIPYKKIYNKLLRKKYFVWVKRKTSEENFKKLKKEFKKLKITGVGFVPERKRFYPKKSLASTIIGFTNLEMQGASGLESTFNYILKSKPGEINCERDTHGIAIPSSDCIIKQPVNGKHIVLTIDESIQFIVEEELKNAVKKYSADGGVAIVMNPNNGEILGMASYPDFNPNYYNKYSKENWKNKAISWNYEPGSTFKVFVVSSALDAHKTRSGRSYFCSSSMLVNNHTIHCAHNHAHGYVGTKEIIQQSCNIGAAQIALGMGGDLLLKYIKKFGFGQKTKIQLLGEEVGILPAKNSLKKFSNITVANVAFGQGISVTPLQMVTALSIIANGGKKVKPILVKEIKNSSGSIEKVFLPKVGEQVVSPTVAKTMLEYMQNAVEKGTGKLAKVPGFLVGGKTGTAQKVIGRRYSGSAFVSSFMGVAPIDNPKLSIIVIIDTPRGAYYGGVVAAPVFSKIAQRVLTYLNVFPNNAYAINNNKKINTDD